MSRISRFRIGPNLRRRILAISLFLAPSLVVGSLVGNAQDMNTLLQSLGRGGVSATAGTTGPQVIQGEGQQNQTFLPSVAPSGVDSSTSRLEQIMSARAGTRLQQFGYDQLGQGRAVAFTQSGAVQDDYVLGLGDEVVVTLRGQENNEFRVTVDRNGQILLPRLNPISAAGRPFGDFRAEVQNAVKQAFIATTAFVSVGSVRQTTVMVTGEVNVPGQRIVPGLSSIVDALVLSGGVKKTGSLRNIRIERAGRTITVDLYGLLTNTGSSGDVRLADGDHILVPALGKVVAVSGLVRRPGVYELPPAASSISAQALLALGGGLEVRAQYRLSVLRISANGSSQLTSLASGSGTIGDSEILFAQFGADQTLNQATLAGGSALAGQFPVVSGTKLSDVLKAPGALPPAPYTLFGIIARKDTRTLLRTLIPFTPVAVLDGSENVALQGDDIIRVLSVNEVRLLSNTVRLYDQRQAAGKAAIRNPVLDNEAAPGRDQDVNAVLADLQRNDIAELAETTDPVTQQARDALYQAQRGQNGSPQSAAGQPQPPQQAQQSLQPLQSLPALQSQQPQQPQQPQQQPLPQSPPAMSERALRLPPALNYQSTDAGLGQLASNREITSFGDLARQLGVDQLVLVNFLSDHQVGLGGAVKGPGAFFVGPNVPLQDLVQAAGGTLNWADESGVELISTVVDPPTGRAVTRRTQLPLRQGMLANYIVQPRDQFRFNQIFNDTNFGSVNVQGEVRFTGTYQITRGERLSDLMARAGGLTSTAYPYGTIFLRKSAAEIERAGYIRVAKEINEQLLTAVTKGGIGGSRVATDPAAAGLLQVFVTQLRNQQASGRITITADPSVLASNPDLDPLLEPGDVVYIPQRPSTISVLGEVMQPGNLPYRSGQTLSDYIQMAGGYGHEADESNAFVVLPDGSARKVESSWLSFSSSVNLPPGSSIVVPRDVTSLDIRQLVVDVTSILSQLAVTTASLSVLSKQ